MTRTGWILAAMSLAASLACAAADDTVEGSMGSDRFVAGGNVSRSEAVAGDLIAAGGKVQLDAPVQGDIVVAGGNVRVGGSAGQNLYAAGGRLNIDARIGRNARVAGGKIEFGSSGAIAGNLTVAGGQVIVRAPVKGYVQAAGGTVTIDAPVEGDVVVNGGELRLGPNAKVGGNVRYRSAEDLVRDPGATVAGRVERNEPMMGMGVAKETYSHRHGVLGGWIWSAGLIVLAALFAVAVPPASMRVSNELLTHPGLSILIGFVALVCIPAAVILLMVTVIGIPLAMVVLLAYLILLVLGYVATAVGWGDAAIRRLRPADAERSSWRVLAAVLAMLVLTLVARVPFVGAFVAFLAMLFGIGAILMAMRSPKPEAAAAA